MSSTTKLTPLQRSLYWQRADAPGRAVLLGALQRLQVGERIRLAEVLGTVPPAAPVEGGGGGGDTGDNQRAAGAEVPPLTEYTSGCIRAADLADGGRETDVAFSSEEPYRRWWGIEVLGHKRGECDLSWLGSGRAPVLSGHDTEKQIGVVLNARIGGDRKGRSRWRFGSSPLAEQERQDAQDGIRVNVSVGYEIEELELVKQEGDERTYRATKWRPLEESLVSVPADMTVGLGRQVEADEDPTPTPIRNTHPPKDTRIMSDTTTTPAALTEQELAAIRAKARDEATKAEQQRTRDIMALATSHSLRELGEKAVAEGTSIEAFRGLALDELHKRGSNKPLYQPAAEIGLSEREAKTFSVARYMRSLIDKDASVAPFESECAKAVRDAMDKAGYRGQGKGNYLPLDVLRQPLPGVRVVDGHLMVGDRVIASQRDLATSSTAAGGAMVGTDLLAADFITLLRNATMVLRMGARRLPGLVGNVSIPRQTGTTTMNWVAQAGAATESDATFAVVTLSPKTAHGIQDVTREMLLQATPGIEGLTRADLLASMAVAIDLAALHGSGSGNQPTGLAATAGIGAEVGGTNGAAPTWDNIVGLETAVANNNAAMGSMGYLTNSRVRGKLKRTQKFASTNGQEIWLPPMAGGDASVEGMLNGYRAGVSNNVSNTLTKGTSSGVCSALFFGNWDDLLIGEWGGAELLPDEVTQAANRIVRFHVYQTLDVAVRRAQSFSAMLDALTV